GLVVGAGARGTLAASRVGDPNPRVTRQVSCGGVRVIVEPAGRTDVGEVGGQADVGLVGGSQRISRRDRERGGAGRSRPETRDPRQGGPGLAGGNREWRGVAGVGWVSWGSA